MCVHCVGGPNDDAFLPLHSPAFTVSRNLDRSMGVARCFIPSTEGVKFIKMSHSHHEHHRLPKNGLNVALNEGTHLQNSLQLVWPLATPDPSLWASADAATEKARSSECGDLLRRRVCDARAVQTCGMDISYPSRMKKRWFWNRSRVACGGGGGTWGAYMFYCLNNFGFPACLHYSLRCHGMTKLVSGIRPIIISQHTKVLTSVYPCGQFALCPHSQLLTMQKVGGL